MKIWNTCGEDGHSMWAAAVCWGVGGSFVLILGKCHNEATIRSPMAPLVVAAGKLTLLCATLGRYCQSNELNLNQKDEASEILITHPRYL